MQDSDYLPGFNDEPDPPPMPNASGETDSTTSPIRNGENTPTTSPKPNAPAPPPPIPDGETLKRKALKLLEATHKRFIRHAQHVAIQIPLSGATTFTADDIRAVVELPPNIGPRLFGAVPKLLASAGIIHSVGMVKSKRPETHRRKIELWALVDPTGDAARRWLADHPELPDPDHGTAAGGGE